MLGAVGSMLAHVGYVAVWPCGHVAVWPQGGLKLGQVGLMLAQVGLMLPHVGSRWPHVGSSWPHVDSSWLQLVSNCLHFVSNWPQLGLRVNFGGKLELPKPENSFKNKWFFTIFQIASCVL